MIIITALPMIDKTTQHKKLRYGYERFCAFITKPRECSIKKELPAWSPCEFNGYPVNENAKAISCIVYDIDCGFPFFKHHLFGGFQYIAHTTSSHLPWKHKWRLIMPLEEPITRLDLWEPIWEECSSYFKRCTGESIDPTCKDPRRFYFLPKKDTVYEYHISDFKHRFYLDVKEIERAYKIKIAKKRKEIEERKKRLDQHIQRTRHQNRDHQKEMATRLKIDEKWRLGFASRIGATIKGNGSNARATGWDCPSCNRNDCTFFYIDPVVNKTSAFCNHRNSCGASYSLFDLGRLMGLF